MSTKIRVLSDHTINKIAAGEVIENPSSVVKELVENAIDAGSKNICIEIMGGGRQLIRISDDGCGMVLDDALLCLERHATSKIRDVEDIHEIHTMGFRGEAVPSIASISKFTLLTSPREQKLPGTLIMVDGGKIISCAPAVRSPGTTIEVKSLFFNVPVRKKFQKSPSFDTNEILKMVSLLALGHADIQFELISDQKPILTTQPSTDPSPKALLASRIESVLGSEFASFLLPIEIEKGDCSIQGFIGTPSHHRQNRSGQYLFINQRAVTSPLIAFAVRDGYGPMLPSQRHPVFVIHLTIPGSYVDINVHPQKKEVRLRQESVIRDLLKQGIQDALQGPSGSFSFETSLKEPSAPLPWEDFPPLLKTPAAFVSEDPQPIPPTWDPPRKIRPVAAPQELFPLPEAPKHPRARVINTIPRYILIDGSPLEPTYQGLCLLDQSAARKRVLFEQLMHHMKQGKDSKEFQQLLIPITIDLPILEASLMRSHLETLHHIGFHIHEFSPNTFHVESLPSFFTETDLKTTLSTLLHDLNDLGDHTQLNKEKEKQIALAVSRSVKDSGKRLTFDEAQSLVNQLMRCDSPLQCPQGKATIAHLDQDEIAKHFRSR